MSNREKWEREIEVLKAQLPDAIEARRAAPYWGAGGLQERIKRLAECRRLEGVVTSLHNRIKYRENKIAQIGEVLPELRDLFDQKFEVGQLVAWSSSSKYAGAMVGWVVKLTPKMVTVSGCTRTYKSLPPFNPDAYGSSLMPKALIICDAIKEKLE